MNRNKDESAQDISPNEVGSGEKKKKKKKSKVAVIILLVLLVLSAVCLGYIGFTVITNKAAEDEYGEVSEIATRPSAGISDRTEAVEQTPSGYNPINLKKLRSINPDVYAWLRIPGTYVDYPVAQSTIDDNYYLHRNIYRRYLFAGMIYTQSCNHKDFNDPITVVYGHNMRSTTMFSSLHYFEKADFFEQNEYFYLYTIDRVLTYRIVSVYKYDNRHIMNSFDFSDPEVLAEYQQNILNPASTLRHVRSGITLDENSKIVILSTCMANDKKSRFLVNGVLISDVPIQEEP
ncbi:MAG TPA: SrtB family sortase [Ruminococcaceae bacterium]|nr:SrtB family sortase [Oscillospiraceae bacterium]